MVRLRLRDSLPVHGRTAPTLRWKGAMAILGVMLAACGSDAPAVLSSTPTSTPPGPLPTEIEPSPIAGTSTPILPVAPTSKPLPTHTATPDSTATVTPTAIPAGYASVPEIVGLHYEQAQQVLEGVGLSYVYRDVFSQDEPLGLVIGQDPGPGAALALGEPVFVYRAFQVVEIRMGEPCQPLRVTSASGRLRFAAYLEQDERYRIRTDFAYGDTVLFDYRMNPVRTLNNPIKNAVVFRPDFTGWYVLMIGPYQISQATVDDWPEGVPMGEFCIIPPEYE
jgi:hypothetical protein